MSDFKIIDLQSDKRIDADDGEEVTLYVRPGGTKSFIVKRAANFNADDLGINQWEARFESGAPINSAFTLITVSYALVLVGGGPEETLVESAAAIMLDLIIPAGFIGINRCSVLCHVGATTLKAVTVKLVILPFDKWFNISWLAQELVDLVWELHSGNAWSAGLAERWAFNGNSQTNYISLPAGADIPFAVIPVIAGVPVITDVTVLSFALRRVGGYDEDPLVEIAPAVDLIDAGGGNKYYALTATLNSDSIQARFQEMNALALANPTLNIDASKMAVFAQFAITYNDQVYVTRGLPFYLEQPAAPLA